MSPGGAAAHTISRAPATAFGIWRNSGAVVAFTALHAVEIDATSPNSSDCDRSASKSLRQSPPSAMATGEVSEHDARVVGVPRDAAVDHRHRHGPGQPCAIGQFAQQRGASVRHEIAASVVTSTDGPSGYDAPSRRPPPGLESCFGTQSFSQLRRPFTRILAASCRYRANNRG